MKVLLIGSGGREHALAWKILQNKNVETLICAPGNAGMAEIAGCVDIAADDITGLIALVRRDGFDLVIVGPEQPLALGLVDELTKIGVKAFGPTQAAAQLESSKAFTKDFCKRYNIPTADYGVFSDIKPAKAFLKTMTPPYVIKADGLAAGKAVVIAEDLKTANAELKAFFSGKFGKASEQVVIEEFMQGQEVSFFAISDGKTALPLIGAQDHKRAYDGDKGPNTGGMGAYSPAPIFGKRETNKVLKTIIQPTIDGMAKDGTPFIGVLFAGLMMTQDGPKLIEYNCRFGDPECQVLMRRLETDIVEIFQAAIEQKLDKLEAPVWDKKPVINVVMATKGYPGTYKKGSEISGIEKANTREDVVIFHAGTRRNEAGALCASGGRVLNITAKAGSLKKAVNIAYTAIDEDIDWPEGFCRRDIAHHALK